MKVVVLRKGRERSKLLWAAAHAQTFGQ